MIPHLAWSVISTVKTNFIIWKILKIVLLPRNPWQHIAYLKLNQPKIKATKFPQKIVCGNATDTALYISASGNAAETRNATSFCSYVFPPSGNVTETWTIRFPQDFRNTETPYFTLCNHFVRAVPKCWFWMFASLRRFPESSFTSSGISNLKSIKEKLKTGTFQREWKLAMSGLHLQYQYLFS